MATWYMYDLWLRMKLIVERVWYVFLDTQAVDEVKTDKVTLVLTEAVCLVVGAFSPTGIPESV